MQKHCFVSWSNIDDGSTRSLAEYCLALSKAGHIVTLVGRGERDEYSVNSNFNVVPIRDLFPTSTKLTHVAFLLKTVRHLRLHKYDTVDVFNSPGVSILPLLGRKAGTVWVLHFRTASIRGGLIGKAKNFLMAREARLYNRITLIDKGIYLSLGLKVQNVDNIAEWPLGINPDEFKVLADKRQELFGDMAKGKIILIYVGKMDYSRRLDKLLKAFSIIKSRGINSLLVMVGDGSDVSRLKQLTYKYSVDSEVLFTGRVSKDKVPEIVSSCDIGLSYIPITAEYEHQPPLKTLEYLQMALPQVATSTAATRKYITNGVNGLLSGDRPEEYAMTLIKMIENPSLREQIKQNSRNGISDYYWQNICEKVMIPFYNSL